MRAVLFLYLLTTCFITLVPQPIVAQSQMGNEFVGQPDLGIRDAQLSPDGLTMAIQSYDATLNQNVIRVYAWDGAAWQEQGDGMPFPTGRLAFSFSQDGLYIIVAFSDPAARIRIHTLLWNEQGFAISNIIHTDLDVSSLKEAHFHLDGQDSKIVLGLFGSNNGGSTVHTFIQEQVNGALAWVSTEPLTLGNSSFFGGVETSISADGNRLSFYTKSQDYEPFLEIYDWADGDWHPLPGELPPIGIADDVSLSGDGQRLAISYAESFDRNGTVRVFDRQGQNWVQLGGTIVNPIPGRSDILGGLSFTGEYLWCGKLFNDAFEGGLRSTGCMQLFRFDDNNWAPFGDVVCGDIESEYGAEITAIAGSGLRTMMGANGNPTSATPLGRVRFFEFTNVFPGNDKPSNAFDILCGQTVSGTTNWAELEAGLPEACAEISPDAANVWYRYQGTGDWVTAALCSADWDTRISVYYRVGVELICVGANDDYDCTEGGNWFGEQSSQFRFFGREDGDYFLMIQEKAAGGGDFELELTCDEACTLPFNQTCAATLAIPGQAAVLNLEVSCQFTRGNNSCGSWATQFSPCVFPGFAYQDLWYRFTTDASAQVTLTLSSAGIANAVTTIYEECGGEAGQCFIGDVDEMLSGLSPNTTYFIQVMSLTDRTGKFDICVSNCSSPTTYYPDFDGDGYGDENAAEELCTTVPPEGMILQGGDCLDFHVNAHEGMEEICDGWDNDCDGIIDNFCTDNVPGMLRVDVPISVGDCSGTLFAQSTGSGEWVYLLSPYGGAVAAFQDLEAMGSVEYSFRVYAEAGRYWNLDGQGLPDEVVASRDITINVQFPPQQDIPVRLFYLKTEIEAFQAAAQQAFLLEEPALEENFSLTKVPAMGCPDGSLPVSPNLIPILSQGGSINGHYLETKVASFSRFFLHVNKFTVLPVEFEAVALRKAGITNELEWWVAAEEGLSHYQIERSRDGHGFVPIGQQAATNYPRYQFVDQQPLAAVYYRIKAVDFDGQFQYSKLLFLQREEPAAQWSVFPNPAAGQTTVMSTHAGEIGVYGALGRMHQQLSLVVGPNLIDVRELPAGVYFLRPTGAAFGDTSANRPSSNTYAGRPVRLVVKSH